LASRFLSPSETPPEDTLGTLPVFRLRMPIATNYAAPVTELLAATTACLHKSCAADAHERAAA
jgi:hypothetical protein